MSPPRILLTGRPGSGKTTVIFRTLELLERPAAGFYTEEVRKGGGGGRGPRVGFDVVALDGRRGRLSRKGAPGPRVGPYGVDVASFEAVGVRALEEGLARPEPLLVVDEIGKMEFLSDRFLEVLDRAFRAPNPLLGTILLRPHPVADRYRHAPGVEVTGVTPENRDGLPAQVSEQLGRGG